VSARALFGVIPSISSGRVILPLKVRARLQAGLPGRIGVILLGVASGQEFAVREAGVSVIGRNPRIGPRGLVAALWRLPHSQGHVVVKSLLAGSLGLVSRPGRPEVVRVLLAVRVCYMVAIQGFGMVGGCFGLFRREPGGDMGLNVPLAPAWREVANCPPATWV
jgi:hypothetical protein